MSNVLKGPLQQFLAAVAGDGAQRIVHRRKAAVETYLGNTDRSILEDVAEPFLAEPKLGFGTGAWVGNTVGHDNSRQLEPP